MESPITSNMLSISKIAVTSFFQGTQSQIYPENLDGRGAAALEYWTKDSGVVVSFLFSGTCVVFLKVIVLPIHPYLCKTNYPMVWRACEATKIF